MSYSDDPEAWLKKQREAVEDAWQDRRFSAVTGFVDECVRLRDSNPFDHSALDSIIMYLSTELWDEGFSQTEIKAAFDAATSALVTYGAGEDRRGDIKR